jgi:hypothetical protein
MYRRLILLTLAVVSFGCSGREICPDGEPVYIRTNIEDAFPAYVREYEGGLSVTSKVLADVQAAVAFKTKAVRLREDLNQANIELQERQKAVLLALQMSPCDTGVRDKGIDFLTDVKSQTKRIPDRLKELHDEAAVRLYSEVSNLLYYPNAARDTRPPTISEDRMRDKLPRHLFDLLSGYNDIAILGVPNVGDALRQHKMAYSSFRQKARKLEDSLTPRIGEMVAVRFPVAWKIYLKYIVMRFGGVSRSEIVKAGTFLNFDITWDDCERIYTQLSKDESVSRNFAETFKTYDSLVEGVTKIASAI